LAEIRFFGYLSELAGTRRMEVPLERPRTLRKLVPSSFAEADCIILINQRVGTLDSEITNQDSVAFMPILSGG